MESELRSFYEELDRLYASGTPEETEAFLEKELRKHSGGCSECFKPMIITICNELGSLYRATGLFDKAEAVFGIARDTIITHLGKNTIEYATVLNNMAGNERLSGDFAASEKNFLECAEIYEKTIGKDNSLYCSLLNNLALLYQEQGRLDEAESLLLRVLDLKPDRGDNDQEQAITYGNLGALYLAMNDTDRSLASLEKSIELYSKNDKDHRVHLAAVYNTLGSLYVNTGSLQEAVSAFEKARDLTLSRFGENHEYRIAQKNIEYVKSLIAESLS